MGYQKGIELFLKSTKDKYECFIPRFTTQSSDFKVENFRMGYHEIRAGNFRMGNLETRAGNFRMGYLETRAGTLEWNILKPDRLINLEINNKRRTSII